MNDMKENPGIKSTEEEKVGEINPEISEEETKHDAEMDSTDEYEQDDEGICKRHILRIVKPLCYIIFIICCIGVFFWFENYPHKSVENGYIQRDFTKKLFFITELPEDRNVAWDSELPELIRKDIEKAKEKGYIIRYSIGNYMLEITFDEEEQNKPIIEICSIDSWPISSYNSLENFSIYKYKNDLYIYGYNLELPDCFEYYVLYSDFSEHADNRTLTYDTNLPFYSEDKGIGTVRFGEFSLQYDEKNTFSFYSDGEVVSSKEFTEPISEVNIYNGMLFTEDKKLYMIYAYYKNDIPEIEFVFVTDDIESLDNDEYLKASLYLNSSDGDYLPILMKGGEYYVIVPNNKEDYNNFSVSKRELNPYKSDADYKMNLVKIEDTFVSAEFQYDCSTWEVLLSFNIKDEICTYKYKFNGYDDRIELSEEDAKKLSVTVSTIVEFRNHIKEIRDIYPNYYDMP